MRRRTDRFKTRGIMRAMAHPPLPIHLRRWHYTPGSVRKALPVLGPRLPDDGQQHSDRPWNVHCYRAGRGGPFNHIPYLVSGASHHRTSRQGG
jgi:hypothetical protein